MLEVDAVAGGLGRKATMAASGGGVLSSGEVECLVFSTEGISG